MLSLPTAVRIFLATRPTDMRKSFCGLANETRHVSAQDPLSGHLFGFFNRRRTVVKVLYWDRNGYCVFAKRLERGTFVDAGDKDTLLTTVCELLRTALHENNQLALQKLDLLRRLYGRKSERINPNQLALALALLAPEPEQPTSEPDAPVIEQLPSDAVPRLKQSAAKRGRRPLPA